MTAKAMPLVGQIFPNDTVKRETDLPNTIDELRAIIKAQIKDRYNSLLEEHLNRS